MERPKEIFFLGRRIYIDSTYEATLNLADEGLDGDSDLRYDVIRIREDLSESQWNEVLLHELLHFCWHQTALPHLLEEQEETVVRSLSPLLATLVKVRRLENV